MTITLPPVDSEAIHAAQKSSPASIYAASSKIRVVGVYPLSASTDVATAFTSQPLFNLKCFWESFSLEKPTLIQSGH